MFANVRTHPAAARVRAGRQASRNAGGHAGAEAGKGLETTDNSPVQYGFR
jgi:hypothetical protein